MKKLLTGLFATLLATAAFIAPIALVAPTADAGLVNISGPRLAVQAGGGGGGLTKASWMPGLTASQWVDGNSAGIVTNTIRDVSYNDGNGCGLSDGITASWSGGTLDYDRGRQLVWGGGHTDYGCNEIYGLPLTTTTISWSRLAESQTSGSPGLSAAFDTNGGFGNGSFLGTTPSSSHSYNRPVYGNNRMWIAGIDSQSTSAGEWTTATYAYDFVNNRWEFYGEGIPNHNSNGFGKWLGGQAIYDRTHNRVYSMAQKGQAHLFFGKDATDQTQNNFIAQSFTYGHEADDYKWGVCAYDLNLWIWGSINDNGGDALVSGDLSNLNAFTQRNASGPDAATVSVLDQGTVAIYHKAARKLYLYNHDFGGDILVIDIPTTLSNGWNSEMVSIGGVNPVVVFSGDNDTNNGHHGPYGRLVGLEFDDGEMLLSLVTHVDSHTYLMRVPATGLN